MSVWFDSGRQPLLPCCDANPDLTYPADLYLEGDDQYQCWFQTSLWAAVALGDPAPFKTVVGHAFFVDDTGQKLSKSKGNIIAPDGHLRASTAPMCCACGSPTRTSGARCTLPSSIYEQVADAYRRIRNTCRFMLQNLADFDPATDAVPYDEMLEVDRWALQPPRLARATA